MQTGNHSSHNKAKRSEAAIFDKKYDSNWSRNITAKTYFDQTLFLFFKNFQSQHQLKILINSE